MCEVLAFMANVSPTNALACSVQTREIFKVKPKQNEIYVAQLKQKSS